MAKGPGRSQAKEKLWRERLSRQQSMGISVREFCRREGLSEPSMYGWRREIARRDGERYSEANRAVPGQRSMGPLLPLRVLGSHDIVAEVDSRIEILLPGNIRVIVRSGLDTELLRQVIETLSLSSC